MRLRKQEYNVIIGVFAQQKSDVGHMEILCIV